jgi:hypothetical protein
MAEPTTCHKVMVAGLIFANRIKYGISFKLQRIPMQRTDKTFPAQFEQNFLSLNFSAKIGLLMNSGPNFGM